VVVTSSAPAPELPAILSTWIFGIVPKNFGGESEKEFSRHPVGTGPFVFVSWKHGEAVTLERNPDYWQQGKPYLEKVVWHAVTSSESRLAQLRSGQLEAIYSPSPSQFEAIENEPETEIGEYPEGYIEMLQLNSKDPLFNDKRVREAITLALDREGMISAILLGHGTPAGSVLPPAQPYHDASIPAPEQNMEKAKSLLAEAVKDGSPEPSMTILVPTEDDFWAAASQIAQQDLEEAGFKVKLQTMETSTWFEVLASGKFDATFGFGYSQTSSPSEMLGYYNGFNAFNTFVDTTDTTELLAKALRTVDPEERAEVYDELQEVIWKKGYLITVANRPYSWAHRTGVEGFYVGTVGIPWLEETTLSG
jgi:peptide/nickel transport system substrate-binding protein